MTLSLPPCPSTHPPTRGARAAKDEAAGQAITVGVHPIEGAKQDKRSSEFGGTDPVNRSSAYPIRARVRGEGGGGSEGALPSLSHLSKKRITSGLSTLSNSDHFEPVRPLKCRSLRARHTPLKNRSITSPGCGGATDSPARPSSFLCRVTLPVEHGGHLLRRA